MLPLLLGLPSFPVSARVTQDPGTNTAVSATTSSTVISWTPASVPSVYDVRLDGAVVAFTTATNAVITGLNFNRRYSVSVEAKTCNQSAGALLQGTVEVQGAGE